jgi:Family of unknown function (DUF6494)
LPEPRLDRPTLSSIAGDAGSSTAVARPVEGRYTFSVTEIRQQESPVDEDAFNMSVRRFLKKLGVTAQREIEIAVREQLEAGELRGDETLEAEATVTVRGLTRDVVVNGSITLS